MMVVVMVVAVLVMRPMTEPQRMEMHLRGTMLWSLWAMLTSCLLLVKLQMHLYNSSMNSLSTILFFIMFFACGCAVNAFLLSLILWRHNLPAP